MRRALTLLTLLLTPPCLAAQDRCADLRAQRAAAAAEQERLAQPTALEVSKFWKAHQIAADHWDVANAVGSRNDLLADLMGRNEDRSFNPDEMRSFAERYGLPSTVRSLIPARMTVQGALDFWLSASRELHRRANEAALTKGSPEDERRKDELREQLQNLDERLFQECQRGRVPDPPTPSPSDGPLPVAYHPATAPDNYRETPIITDWLINRWINANRVLIEGGSAHWRAGRMTQLDYLAVTKRVRDFSSYACTRSGVGTVVTVTCGITDANRASLARYFTWDEIAAFTRYQDDVGDALTREARAQSP